MSNHYSPKIFFRKVPNNLLKQYFTKHNVLTNFDFKQLKEKQIEELYQAWIALPEEQRNQFEQDFQQIDSMATEGGSTAIIDEGKYHGEDLAETFSVMKSFHERAFWTFLEKHQYWEVATAFNHAGTIAYSYWRKRKNLPSMPLIASEEKLKQFENSLANYFHTHEGRGKNCKIDHYKRGEKHYFFALPEDYAQTAIEWDKKELKRRSHTPAFETIFIFSPIDGTLDIYTTSNRKIVTGLQKIFSHVLLGVDLQEEQKDERVYNLNLLSDRHFKFIYNASSGIQEVRVIKMRIALHGSKQRILLEADPKGHKDNIYDLRDDIGKGVFLAQSTITQIQLKIIKADSAKPGKNKTVNCTITYPNSCNLKHNEFNESIRKMLIDSNIEPRLINNTEPKESEATCPA